MRNRSIPQLLATAVAAIAITAGSVALAPPASAIETDTIYCTTPFKSASFSVGPGSFYDYKYRNLFDGKTSTYRFTAPKRVLLKVNLSVSPRYAYVHC